MVRCVESDYSQTTSRCWSWPVQLDLAPARWEYLRPLGLLTWWGVAQLGGDGDIAVRLHLLNTLMHGVNAALVATLALWLGKPVRTATFAAALFLVWPIAVEPVVWPSAIFDVQLTMFALILCLVVVKQQELRRRDYVLCLVLTVLMIGTKETGVIAGPLALLAHWTRWGYNLRALGMATMLGGVAVGYALIRSLAGRVDSRLTPSLDSETVERLFTHSFGVLFVPLHDVVLKAFPPAALFVPIALIVLVVSYVRRWHVTSEDARLALFAGGTVVLAVAPTITPFGVLGDLQGSRYMHLAVGDLGGGHSSRAAGWFGVAGHAAGPVSVAVVTVAACRCRGDDALPALARGTARA